jgi:chromate transporter
MNSQAISSPAPPPTFAAALRFWGWLGLFNFGGPSAQIALMHDELVVRRGWIHETTFAKGLNLCMLLPGPEAQQLATFCGWKLHGVRGALAAGTLFILPAALLMMGIALAYAMVGDHSEWRTVFKAVEAPVVAVLGVALWRMGQRLFVSRPIPLMRLGLAVAAGAIGGFVGVPYPALLAATVLLATVGVPKGPTSLPMDNRPSTRRLAVVPFGMALSALPTLWLAATGAMPQMATIGWIFFKTGWLGFGGAYALIPGVARELETLGAVQPSDLSFGLAAAEASPGPLLLVLQFLAAQAGWRNPGDLSPVHGAFLGGFLALWGLFVPSFALILSTAPWVDRIPEHGRVHTIVATFSGTALGLLASLAAVIAVRAFLPIADRLPVSQVLGALLAIWLLAYRKWSIPAVIGTGTLAGLLLNWLRNLGLCPL